MDDLMRIITDMRLRFRWAVRHSLERAVWPAQSSSSDNAGMMEREV
jgi:hypothetical protein